MCHLLTGLFSFPFERPPSPRSHHAVHNLVKKSRTQPGFKDCKEFSHWQNSHHTVHNLVKKSRTQPINKDSKELSHWHHPVHNLVNKDCTALSWNTTTKYGPGCAQNYNVKKLWKKCLSKILKQTNKPPPGWCYWPNCPPFQTTNTTNNKHNNKKVKHTSARLVLLAPLPPFPYRPREIFRPSTKYVRIRPFPFTWNAMMDFNIFGIEKTY